MCDSLARCSQAVVVGAGGQREDWMAEQEGSACLDKGLVEVGRKDTVGLVVADDTREEGH